LEIKSLPDIPQGLIDAAARGVLVPFIGAGVSQLAGCPRWAEFADKVLEQLVQKRVLRPAQRSQLSALSPRVKLSIAKITAKKAGVEIDYATLLHKTTDWHENKDGRAVYGHLSALSRWFITTNYDEWLDRLFPGTDSNEEEQAESAERREQLRRNKLYRPEDFRADEFRKPDTVLHLHGALEDPDGMILSTRDYIERYANDRHHVGGDGENLVLSFLEFLFQQRTILFVGYGLEELEVLEYVIMKAQDRSGRRSREARHYMLQGFFTFEEGSCDALREYFLQQCGVELIPFSRDEEDWRQLIHVLEDFVGKLPKNDPLTVQDFREMEGLVNG